MKQSGFALPGMLQLVVIAVALSAVISGVMWFAHINYERGADAKQVEWDEANRRAAEEDRARRNAINAALEAERRKRAEAETAAASADRKWKEALRANRNAALSACSPPAPAGPVVEAGESVGTLRFPRSASPGPADSGAVLLWRFVGLYDGAYTAIDGQPLFGAAAGYALAPERAGSPAPYGLDDVIDVHGENARAHSDCIRKFDQAVSAIERAARAWEMSNQGGDR